MAQLVAEHLGVAPRPRETLEAGESVVRRVPHGGAIDRREIESQPRFGA